MPGLNGYKTVSYRATCDGCFAKSLLSSTPTTALNAALPINLLIHSRLSLQLGQLLKSFLNHQANRDDSYNSECAHRGAALHTVDARTRAGSGGFSFLVVIFMPVSSDDYLPIAGLLVLAVAIFAFIAYHLGRK